MKYQDAVSVLNDPSSSATQLQQIAHDFPELHPAIANHPNIYPALLAWLTDRNEAHIPQEHQRAMEAPDPNATSGGADATVTRNGLGNGAHKSPQRKPSASKKRVGLVAASLLALALVGAGAALAWHNLLGNDEPNPGALEGGLEYGWSVDSRNNVEVLDGRGVFYPPEDFGVSQTANHALNFDDITVVYLVSDAEWSQLDGSSTSGVSEGALVAYSMSDGQVRWTRAMSNFESCAGIDDLLVCAFGRVATAIEPSTGESVWELEIDFPGYELGVAYALDETDVVVWSADESSVYWMSVSRNGVASQVTSATFEGSSINKGASVWYLGVSDEYVTAWNFLDGTRIYSESGELLARSPSKEIFNCGTSGLTSADTAAVGLAEGVKVSLAPWEDANLISARYSNGPACLWARDGSLESVAEAGASPWRISGNGSPFALTENAVAIDGNEALPVSWIDWGGSRNVVSVYSSDGEELVTFSIEDPESIDYVKVVGDTLLVVTDDPLTRLDRDHGSRDYYWDVEDRWATFDQARSVHGYSLVTGRALWSLDIGQEYPFVFSEHGLLTMEASGGEMSPVYRINAYLPIG